LPNNESAGSRQDDTMHQLLKLRWLLGAAAIIAGGALPVADAAARARVADAYGQLPLSFEANEGQVDRAVKFLSRGQGYDLFLTPTEAVFTMKGVQRETAVVRMQFAGGRRAPRLVGLAPQPTRSNYFLGNDPRQWHIGVPSYAQVRYVGIYPGVDLVYRGNQRQLEYDFVIAPGADPSRIRLAFRGADAITIGTQGELILHTANGELVQHAPAVYQEAGGRRQRVEGRYRLLAAPAGDAVAAGAGAACQIGFAVGRYDRARPLLIDPVVSLYSTFLGGSGDDHGYVIAVDGAGNAYVTGYTYSTTFPGVSGSSIQPANSGRSEVFVTKINPGGTAIVYSTFLGGSGDDFLHAIAVDGAGNAYITGSTTSTTFPGVSGSSIQPANSGGYDAFLTKINPGGTAIVYSTFLGGSGFDSGNGIAVDSAGNAYLTGATSSTTFPGVSGSSIQPANAGGDDDAFVTKINPEGTAIVYSTFLGGSGYDVSVRIAIDGGGNAYVTGVTDSTALTGVSGSSIQPANGGGVDTFVTKINPAGTAIVYSTFLGGSGYDSPWAIAVDAMGNAYVTGYTNSTNFPGVSGSSIQPANGGGYDAFVTKINSGGTSIVYSTFLGGSGDEEGRGIAVDGAGNAYITGGTDSTTWPGVSGSSIQPAIGGGWDAFVTEINPGGTAIVYSTFLGGSGDEEGRGIAVDGAGNIYVTGETNSITWPGVSGSSIQPANGGGYDAFVTKIGEAGLGFFTVSPCRMVDTRNAAGPLGGPALQPGAARIFVVTGACGVPSSAKALSVNVTVTQPAAAGDLRLLPGDQSILTIVSSINFAPGQTRANNAIALLAFDGSGGLKVVTDSAGSVHLILDVDGYFQ
jgi:hypothetical protein